MRDKIRHIWDLLQTGSPQEQQFARDYLQRWGSVAPKDDGWFAADRHWLTVAGAAYASRGLSFRESEDMARQILLAAMKTSAQI
jgi:hypothetical protein